MAINKLQDFDFQGKRVLVRLDLNVPIKDGKIIDDTRIRAALPTLEMILKATNRVVIMSHLGRPQGEVNLAYSLEPVGEHLAELLDREVVFVDEYLEEPVVQVVDQLDTNQIVLLENLRFYPGETANDLEFARKIAEGFDVYVNDAFGTLHRAHASVAAMAELLPRQSRVAGLLVEKEIAALSSLLTSPAGPFVVVMGGSKVSDKMGVILSLLNRCNKLLIGGAMAYTFLKYQGVDVGSSRVEEDKLDLVADIYRNAAHRRVEILLPLDHVGASDFSEAATPVAVPTASIPAGIMGLDIGPKTQALYREIVLAAKTILWNGPMGVFEWPAYASGSLGIAKAMAEAPGRTIIGGGDSVSAANLAGVAAEIDHISTGGGATLEYLEGRVLPGLRVLQS
jgi:phosphoglycerate kinase